MKTKVNIKLIEPYSESGLPPSLWVADMWEVPATTWFKAPMSNQPLRKGTIEDMTDSLSYWHVHQNVNVTAPFETGPNYIPIDEPEPQMDVTLVQGGMQGYLCFFPEAGETVWIRTIGRYETNTNSSVGEIELDSEGTPVVQEPTGTPDSDDPFRFVGYSGQGKPYMIGPFSRNRSIWVYHDGGSEMKFRWIPLLGSNAAANINP